MPDGVPLVSRDRRRYGQQLHGGEEHCVAVTVNIAALYAAFEGPYQHRADGENQQRQPERNEQAGASVVDSSRGQ